MKVIDLFNQGANGEKMPEKIKYNEEIYYLDDGNYSTYNKYGYPERLFQWGWSLFEHLNDEVEVIEEDKKIKHIESYVDFANLNDSVKFDYLYEMITRIIDKLNSMEDK